MPTLLTLFVWVMPVQPDPAAETLALIPPKPAIMLVVRDARRHTERLAASPFAGWAKRQPEGVTATTQFAVLAAGANFLSGVLGVTLQEFLDDIAGDIVVFTYTPPTPGSPEVGVVYVKPRRAQTLDRLLLKLGELQTASGELTGVEPLSHAGHGYTARRKPGNRADYLAVRDGVYALSAHEPAIQDFLTRAPGSPHQARLKSVSAEAALAVALFEPRAFDAELQSRQKSASDPGEAAFLLQFNRVWGALDAVAVSVTPGVGLDFAATATYRREALPAELSDFAATPGRTTPPPPAGAIVRGHVPLALPKLIALGKSLLTESAGRELDAWLANGVGPAVGRDRLPGLIQSIGSDIEWLVLPPDAGGWVPAWRLAIALDDPTASAHAAVNDGLAVLSQFLRYDYNSKHKDQLSIVTQDGITTASAPGLPPGLAPSYRVMKTEIVIASRPALIASPPRKDAQPPALAFIDAVALRRYLQVQRLPVAGWLARQGGTPVADAAKELDTLLMALDALKTLELRAIARPGVVQLRLTVAFAQPLADSR